jgi:outer membrane protein assembly factor BamB
VASWEIPTSQQQGDVDFIATPNIFTADINGSPTEMVGLINKNGYYYAFSVTNGTMSSAPVWEDHLGPGGGSPFRGHAALSPAAWDGQVLYMAGADGTIGTTSCAGTLQAVNPATGTYLWRDCLSASVFGAVLAIPGVVFVNHGQTISAYNASTGAQLFSYSDTSSSISDFWGAPTVANGWLYDGNLDGTFYAFR